jgi:hypothetical protein
VFFQGGVDLSIKIVQDTGYTPGFLVFAKFGCIEMHGSLDGQHVPDKVLIFYILMNDAQGFITIHIGSSGQLE